MAETQREVSRWHFKDLWKKNKVVTHVTKIFFIIIIEMKSQQSFSLAEPTERKGTVRNGGAFFAKKEKEMMAKGKLTIEARLSVSDETAAACVALLNMYLKENAPELIVKENKETGVTQIEIRRNNATIEQ